MSRDCEVCRGSKRIRVPIYKFAMTEYSGDLPPTADEMSREYPCPECSAGDVVPFERLAILSDHFDGLGVLEADPRFLESGYVRMATALGRGMLERGLIRFEKIEPRLPNTFCIKATVGVASPVAVAKFEERVAERQFEVAEALIEVTRAEILEWGAHAEPGKIGRWAAVEWLRNQLQKMRSRHG